MPNSSRQEVVTTMEPPSPIKGATCWIVKSGPPDIDRNLFEHGLALDLFQRCGPGDAGIREQNVDMAERFLRDARKFPGVLGVLGPNSHTARATTKIGDCCIKARLVLTGDHDLRASLDHAPCGGIPDPRCATGNEAAAFLPI